MRKTALSWEPRQQCRGLQPEGDRMTESTATTKPVTAISRTAALLVFAGAATFVVLLVALHFIKPGLDPSWHFISGTRSASTAGSWC